jgi:hypothetical protein
VEGFVRQLLGWREFIRGVSWLRMPGYIEKNHLEVPPYPANPYGAPNLWTLHSDDGFATLPDLIRVTADAFPKGHKMADTLSVGNQNIIYEVFHSNKGELEAVDYNIFLTMYSQDWDVLPDVIGPKVNNMVAIDNPFNSTYDRFELYATINDAATGMSPIEEAQYTETPVSITDSRDVDWSIAVPMNLTGNTPIEVANTTVKPVAWIPGEVHRIWIRGKDSVGNWGEGSYIDVVVVGPSGSAPGSPALLSVELGGVGSSDVVIAWSLSPDDGSPGFEGYYIYAGGTFSPGRFGYGLLTPIPLSPGTTIHTHAGAGVGDTEDYFYVVVAANDNGVGRASANQGAKLAKHCAQGTGMVSIPLNLSSNDLVTILGTFDYNIAWWFDPTAPSDHWKSHNPNRPVNDLSHYNRTMALWVEVNSDSYLTVAGMVPSSTYIPIYSGWNLIGHPSFSSRTVSDMLSSISYERVEAFDENLPPEKLRLLGDSDFMDSEGYWVKASAPGMLTVTNP